METNKYDLNKEETYTSILSDTWYSELGFKRNPFFLEPLSSDNEGLKSFIDREGPRADLEKFIQERRGSCLVASKIGCGKSSFLNLAEILGKNRKKLIIRIDPRKLNSKLEEGLVHIILQLKKIPYSNVEGNKIQEILIEKTEKLENMTENNLKNNLQSALDELTSLFNEIPTIIIIDDLDKKTEMNEFKSFIQKVIDPLPKNVLLLATADLNHLQNAAIIELLYSLFDFPIILDEISNLDDLKKFVNGRLKSNSFGEIKIKFDEDLLKALHERTKGNLRESFRYLSELIKLNHSYSVENLIKVMRKIDIMRIALLDSRDKKILNLLSGERMHIKDLIDAYRSEEREILNLHTLRKIINNLIQLGFVFKNREEKTRRMLYHSPSIIKEVIKDTVVV